MALASTGRAREAACAAEPALRERAKPNQRRSRVIGDFNYDSSRKKLYVTFVGGDTYVCVGVPPDR
jgi:hypothetical protein